MTRPVVGVTTYLSPARWGAWDTRAALLHAWYVDALRRAGAVPVLLPPDEAEDGSVVARLDALVLVGGSDIDSRRYGAEPHETADAPHAARDASDLALYRAARDRDLPVLGICRGLQVMAVAHGGRLHQNIPDLGLAVVHRDEVGQFVSHGVRLEPGSRIASIYGETDIVVNSSHHQAAADAGDLVVSGIADDGLIEALEDPAARFALAVQWHPEHPDRASDSVLFDALVAAATAG